ncbi:MAG TPA: hypothetical protein VEB19_13400 [Gemmatimonadaceae bacterium]|nr:hypothetical protein [Gemmatimonadaceae bacterium]
MRLAFAVTLAAAMIAGSTEVVAQTARPAERGLYLTIFRSPSTGLEWRTAHVGVHGGYYPTVITRDGQRENVNFGRAGVTWYAKSQGAGVYVSPSVVWSLSDGWKNGALTDAGFRGRVFRALNGRLGVGVLTTTDGEVRVNPTVGLDIKLGAGR